MTDVDGVYTLTLPAGTYTLTPSKNGYSFSPAQRTVTVSGGISGVDFTGIADGGPPTPFLDLPLDYDHSATAFAKAARDTNEADGRVNSWFDHAYPDYGKNGRLVLYDGKVRTRGLYNPSLGCYENRCYDGHNGLDLVRLPSESPNLSVHPAAPGRVAAVSHSDIGYGNHVVLYHDMGSGCDGYFTLYGHLKSIDVSVGNAVTVTDTLGIMGSTGHSGGPHLHFGVYRDNGNGRWDGERIDKPVDPYGWKGATPDPWVADRHGPVSYYLWKYPLAEDKFVAASRGDVMTDTTGSIQSTIPPDSFSGQATFELSPGTVGAASAQLRSSGHSFRLRLLEWLPGIAGQQTAAAQSQPLSLQATAQFTLTKPVTLTVHYTDADVLHLDVSQLSLRRWDEAQSDWQPLPTIVDPIHHVLTATTRQLGDFDMQAPLLCPTDDLEPDDNYAAAQWARPNDWPLSRGLDIPQDKDWVRLDAVPGVTYTIRTQNLAGGADTILNLYDVDAATLLASDDNVSSGPASELTWTAPYTGTFFVEVVSAPGGNTGCTATYELAIETIPGDVVPDCQVNTTDLQAVADRWRLNAATPDPDGNPETPNYETLFDLNKDGVVDVLDVMQVAAKVGQECLPSATSTPTWTPTPTPSATPSATPTSTPTPIGALAPSPTPTATSSSTSSVWPMFGHDPQHTGRTHMLDLRPLT